MVLVAAVAAAAEAEVESTDSMEHCLYESAEAWRRGDRSRALQRRACFRLIRSHVLMTSTLYVHTLRHLSMNYDQKNRTGRKAVYLLNFLVTRTLILRE